MADPICTCCMGIRLPALAWTTERPTEPGLYWFHGAIEEPGIGAITSAPDVVRIRHDSHDGLTVWHIGWDIPDPLDRCNGLWCRLPEPPEASDG